MSGETTVSLRPYGPSDFWLLERANTPEATAQLGGPESAEKLADRHRRYCDVTDPVHGRMYVVLDGAGAAVGTIGFWERETVYETGWFILPECQGRGLATAAARAVAEAARAAGGHRELHAYPKTGHAASNAVCRKAGFTLLGAVDFEYPKGNPIRSNDWCLDLVTGDTSSSRPSRSR